MTAVKYLLYVGGLTAIVTGCSLIYRPAGYIVGGLLLFGISMLIDKAQNA